MGDEDGGLVGRYAAVLLQPLLLVDALGTETMEMGPGDFMMIPRGVRHRVQRLGDAKAYFATVDTPPVDPKKIVWLEQAPKK